MCPSTLQNCLQYIVTGLSMLHMLHTRSFATNQCLCLRKFRFQCIIMIQYQMSQQHVKTCITWNIYILHLRNNRETSIYGKNQKHNGLIFISALVILLQTDSVLGGGTPPLIAGENDLFLVVFPVYPYSHLETWTCLDSGMESMNISLVLRIFNHLTRYNDIIFYGRKRLGPWMSCFHSWKPHQSKGVKVII